MARDAYILEDRSIVLFWSRKAGNTSLAEWICQIVAPTEHWKRSARAFLEARDYRFNATHALRMIEREGYDDWVLARNPYRRAMSVFVEKFIFYSQQPMDGLDHLEPFAQRAFLDIMEMRGRTSKPEAYHRRRYPGISFVDFLDYINVRVAERARDGEPHLNPHWNTQVPLAYEGRFSYSNVIKLERIRDEIPRLAERLGTTIPFPHARPNVASARVVNDEDLSEVSSLDMVNNGVIPGVHALLNEKTRALIRTAYRLDFLMLGYDPDEVIIERVREEQAPPPVDPRVSAKLEKRWGHIGSNFVNPLEQPESSRKVEERRRNRQRKRR